MRKPADSVNVIMRAYGIAMMCIAVTSIALAFSVQVHGLRIPFYGVATFIGFGIFCLLLSPAIHTYGTFGIVEEGDRPFFQEPNPDIAKRRKLMEQRFPYFSAIERCVYLSIGAVFLVAIISPVLVDPFIYFCGALCLLAGLWTVFALPYAQTALTPLSYNERIERMSNRDRSNQDDG